MAETRPAGARAQAAIVAAMTALAEEHGMPPTIREIMEHCGFPSTGTTFYHLKRLEEAGVIERWAGHTRTWRLIGQCRHANTTGRRVTDGMARFYVTHCLDCRRIITGVQLP